MAKTVLVPPLPNGEITAAARGSLKGFFGKCALIAFTLFILEFGITFTIESLPLSKLAIHFLNGAASVFCNTILGLAFFKFCGKIADDEENPEFKPCIEFAWKRFAVVTLAGWYAGLIIILKFFLLIVPGVMAIYDYALVPFITLDEPDIKISDSLKLSRRLMYGHRWQLFCLYCRFIGWALLSLLTLGIGFFWLIPYMSTTMWKFYRSITPSPNSIEATELPELAPYSGMSPGWRIFWLIILIIFGAYGDVRSDRQSDAIVQAVEKTLGVEDTEEESDLPQDTVDKKQ